jgi:hypothetical protein
MAELGRPQESMKIPSHGIELKVFKDPTFFGREFWVRIPISEEMLYHYWGSEKQPSIEDLLARIACCFRDWLEENSDRGNPNPTDPTLPEFFD